VPALPKAEIKPGLYFSPGFYMAYWQGCILAQFPLDVVEKHTAMTKYRELFVGAILAAANTLASGGTQYFVGLPATEPPDIDLMYYEPTVVNGKKGVKRKHIDVEIVRCNMEEGETLLGQIKIKNKPAYQNMIVAVFMEGRVSPIDFEAITQALHKEARVYPSQILIVLNGNMAEALSWPDGTFGLARVYPGPGSSVINISDEKAFFRIPEVVGDTNPKLGVSEEWRDLGPGLTILPPKI
jgi:hypothetical protein